MKIKFIGSNKKELENYTQRLTIGKEYIVLGIEFYDKSSTIYRNVIDEYMCYRIEDNDRIVISIPSNLFEITSEKLSAYWIGCRTIDGVFRISPKKWIREGFWDDFYNHEKDSLQDYEMVYQSLYVEELSDEEINSILECGEKKEVEYLIRSLISSNDSRVKQVLIKTTTCEKWDYLWELSFRYLSNFKEEEIVSIFGEFLFYNERLYPKITSIINDYFQKS